MAGRNRFERVDEVQDDAITLSLKKGDPDSVGTVTFPASASGGRLANDSVSEELPMMDAFRSAIRLANTVKVPVVVLDPDNVWLSEWGELYRPVER
jgi:hypothetical protein